MSPPADPSTPPHRHHFHLHLRTIPRHFLHLIRGYTPRHVRLRNHLLTLLLLTLVIDAVASYFIFYEERGAVRAFGIDPSWAHVKDYWDAAFFTTTQLLTVSSLMNNPYTTSARIIDVGLELWGIAVVGALAGAFGAFFLEERHVQLEQHHPERGQPARGATSAGGPPAPA